MADMKSTMIEWDDGTKLWYLNGKLHREDGPAAERATGTNLWFLNGEPLTMAEWVIASEKDPDTTAWLMLQYV